MYLTYFYLINVIELFLCVEMQCTIYKLRNSCDVDRGPCLQSHLLYNMMLRLLATLLRAAHAHQVAALTCRQDLGPLEVIVPGSILWIYHELQPYTGHATPVFHGFIYII